MNVKIMSSSPATNPTTAHLIDAGRVAVEGGVGDLLHQLGVGGRQVLLDLPQDPLFVLGERHRSHFRVPGSVVRVPIRPSCGAPPIVAHGLVGCSQRVGRPGPSRGKATAAAPGPDGTGTEAGPHGVDRPLQRGLPIRAGGGAGLEVGEQRSPGVVGRRRAERRRSSTAVAPTPARTELLHRHAEQADAPADVEASSSSRATWPMSAARSVGSASVRERVMVRKSAKRTLSCTVRPVTSRGPQPRRHAVGQPHDLRCSSTARSWRSTGNVSSCPIDFTSWSGSTGRSSRFQASACRC